MNENINFKINFLRVTLKRKLEAIWEVLSSEETSNYHNEPEDIISEINFVKVLVERNLKTLREALETEETSNYHNEQNESDKIVEKTLGPNSFRNSALELSPRQCIHKELIEEGCYLAGIRKEMKAKFVKSQAKFIKYQAEFIKYQTEFTELKNTFTEFQSEYNQTVKNNIKK